jgi:hypothetical protein
MIAYRPGDSLPVINLSSVNSRIPRRVHFDSLSVRALNVAVLMLLCGVVIFVWMSYGTIAGMHVQHVLRLNGRTVSATITRISENRVGELVRYAFSVDGVLYSGQAEMEGVDYTAPGDRNSVLVRYLPSDPRVNQPINWQWISAWDFFPLLLLMSITGIGANVILKAFRLKTLMRFGIVTEGRVTACAPKNKLFTVYYEFRAEGDATVEGSCDLLDEYEAGAKLPVIYLRSNPKKNRRFPVEGFRIAAE